MKVQEIISKAQAGAKMAKWLVRQHQHVNFTDAVTIKGYEVSAELTGMKLLFTIDGVTAVVVSMHDYTIDNAILKTYKRSNLKEILYWVCITMLEFQTTMYNQYEDFMGAEALLDNFLYMDIEQLDTNS